MSDEFHIMPIVACLDTVHTDCIPIRGVASSASTIERG